jgi:hypothetical protein
LQYAVRSLGWPRNRAALRGAVWDIYCHREELGQIEAIVMPLGLPVVFHDAPRNLSTAEILMAAMSDHARICIEDGAAMFTAMPDLIFGDGSIEAMVTLASENRRLCIAMPHPRVNEEFVHLMPKSVIGNPELVSLAMNNLHPSFASSDLSLEAVNCWSGGVAWRRLGPDLYGVTCNAPTIFLAQLIDEDLPLIQKAGSWDHTWPSHLEGRQRLIGSSDAAFVVELTQRHTHKPHVRRKPPGAPYTYRHDLLHHRVNRNTVAIWRGN